MKYLLDTHLIIWFLRNDDKIPSVIKSLIIDGDNQCFVSIVSLWEISIKYSLGRLDLPVTLEELDYFILESGFSYLPVEQSHIFQSAKLPFHHQDPFDRLIIGQAIEEDFQLMSKDRQFSKYEVSIHPWK